MKQQIAEIRESLRSSLWFIPAICMAFAFALSEVALRIDQGLKQDSASWFLFGGSTESARALIQVIAASILTFTGLVFTVTMLVLQLASNQLSPRVMRTFLRDRSNQVVLGVFVGTFLYALLILRRITGVVGEGEPFVPALSVWLALVSVILSIGLFIYFIHHMAQAIRPVAVMARVAQETHNTIDRLYPAGVGHSVESADLPLEAPVTAIVLSPGPSGVLTRVNEGQIVEAARLASCGIEMRACIGDFVREGAALFRITGSWDGSAASALMASVSFGSERTMEQDAAFGFRQLVDIAGRALSSGINDPTTAVASIDQIHSLLGHLAVRAIPSPLRMVEESLIVVLPRPGWADYVSLACDEIRRFGRDQIQIQRRMRAMLLDLLELAPKDRRGPLEEQLALLDAHLQATFNDLERVRAATPREQGQGPPLTP